MIGSDIITDLNCFFEQSGHPPVDWYVGIASDAERKLFNDHKVSRHLDSWIYRIADNSEIARSVQKDYLNLGCCGPMYPEDSKGIMVYAYLRSANTFP